MGDVSELIEETINRVRQGSLDPRSANTIGFLAGIQMKAITAAQAEAKEAKAKENPPFSYMTFFERMRSEGKLPEQKVYDLYPPEPTPSSEEEDPDVALGTLPPLGESIDDSQPTPESPENPQREIVIEVS